MNYARALEEEIKELTDNKNGIDITYREVLDPTHDNYYDWMSYEIINASDNNSIVPGTVLCNNDEMILTLI